MITLLMNLAPKLCAMTPAVTNCEACFRLVDLNAGVGHGDAQKWLMKQSAKSTAEEVPANISLVTSSY